MTLCDFEKGWVGCWFICPLASVDIEVGSGRRRRWSRLMMRIWRSDGGSRAATCWPWAGNTTSWRGSTRQKNAPLELNRMIGRFSGAKGQEKIEKIWRAALLFNGANSVETVFEKASDPAAGASVYGACHTHTRGLPLSKSTLNAWMWRSC